MRLGDLRERCLSMMDNCDQEILGETIGCSLATGRHLEPGASRHHSSILVLPDGSQLMAFTGCTEAFQTDPMQRLSLVTAFEALEMAGYVPNRTRSTKLDRIGTFYGQTSDDWREINAAQDVDTYYITGGVRAFGPGRINYHFGFSGPSFRYVQISMFPEFPGHCPSPFC